MILSYKGSISYKIKNSGFWKGDIKKIKRKKHKLENLQTISHRNLTFRTSFKAVTSQAGEMAQQLETLAALPEDLSLISSNLMVAHLHL